jgi:hypothetical protein
MISYGKKCDAEFLANYGNPLYVPLYVYTICVSLYVYLYVSHAKILPPFPPPPLIAGFMSFNNSKQKCWELLKNSGMGAARKAGRGRGVRKGVGGVLGSLYKGPQRPPASRIPSPASRARGLSHISAFPTRCVPTNTPRGGRGQGYCVPTARVITQSARVESQRDELTG